MIAYAACPMDMRLGELPTESEDSNMGKATLPGTLVFGAFGPNDTYYQIRKVTGDPFPYKLWSADVLLFETVNVETPYAYLRHVGIER